MSIATPFAPLRSTRAARIHRPWNPDTVATGSCLSESGSESSFAEWMHRRESALIWVNDRPPAAAILQIKPMIG
jgi:hypothetical protein